MAKPSTNTKSTTPVSFVAAGHPCGEIASYVLVLGIPLLVYNFVLVERKFNVLLGHGVFLLQYKLNINEAVLFVLLSTLIILLFFLTAITLLRWSLRLAGGHATTIAAFIVSTTFFLVVTAEFEVYRYFRDGINMALLKGLGGGDWRSAVGYIEDELVGLLPVIVAGAVIGGLGIWGLKRYGNVVAEWLANVRWVRVISSWKGLLGFNLVFCLLPLVIFIFSPGLDKALSRFIIYRIYMVPAIHLTDFDGDGYSLMSRPMDQELFDASLRPYAMEIPGNDIDENNIGGDLKELVWERNPLRWENTRFKTKNVLLIVIESARYDLLDARINGESVMPILGATPGQHLRAFSHVAFSTPSVVAILNGVIDKNDAGQPLITNFKRRGYRTGVFSGQHEGFGNKASLAHMHDADVFRDPTTEDIEARMYSPTTPGSLKMPATVMNQRFIEWLDAGEGTRPFFAYLNWQETHFPYYFRGAKIQLVDKPIPRSEIKQDTREWVQRTYMNAGRAVDDAFATVKESLLSRGLWDNTVILVVGDHGEELFDNGYLGHGTNLSYEQNMTILKLINADWTVPVEMVGLGDISRLVFNSLVQDPADITPLMEEILSYVGKMERPMQIGLVRENGLVKYDFYKNIWSFQREPGMEFEPTAADDRVIHLWESYLIKNTKQEQ